MENVTKRKENTTVIPAAKIYRLKTAALGDLANQGSRTVPLRAVMKVKIWPILERAVTCAMPLVCPNAAIKKTEICPCSAQKTTPG